MVGPRMGSGSLPQPLWGGARGENLRSLDARETAERIERKKIVTIVERTSNEKTMRITNY
jgi:hypothetical protein